MAPRPKRSPLRAITSALILFFDAAMRELFRRPGGDRTRTDWTQVPDRRPRLVSAWKPVPDRRPRVVSAWKPVASGKRRVRRRRRLPVRRTLAVAMLLLLGGAVTLALFTKTTANSGNTYASAADFRAPTVSASVIQPNGGNNGSAGEVKQGQAYFVYANVADTGSPASGISSVTANVCNVTTASCSSVALTAGSFTVNSISYNYRSAVQTASNPLSEGSKSYSIAATDVATNSGNTNFSVTVDNTGPTVTRQIICGGSGCTTTDYVGAGKTYYAYAQVSDAASGVNTVNANLAVASNVITTGATSVSMTTAGGPWTIGGNSYNYRSAQQTADAGLVNASTKSWNLTAADNLGNSTNPSDTATVDNTAPAVGAMALDKNFGRFHDYIRSSAPYFLYAAASDAASGIDTANATANVAIDAPNTITTGQTNVEMCYSGSGYSLLDYHNPTSTSFDFKSDFDGTCDASFTSLTTDASIPNGPRNWNVTVADNAGNTATLAKQASLNSTQNTAVDVKIRNTGGGINGRLELGDDILFNASDSTDPGSAGLSGWDGAADSTGNVVARLINGGGTCVASSDQLEVWNATNTVQTNIGTICLGSANYTTATMTFGLTGTPSTLEAGFTNPWQLTLGTPSATATTVGADTTATWTPGSGMFDLAGNTTLTTPASNSIDNTGPTISATRLCGGSKCSADWVGQGKTYFVYANTTDANSGIKDITADLSNITTGASAVDLPACVSNCTVNGTTYAYKSAQQTANGTLTGTKAWTLSVTDNFYNKTSSTPTATVDNTAPTIGTTTIAKSSGTGLYLNGKIKPSAGYYVYANVTDANSGVDTVTANVNNITSGQTAVPMTSGSFSVNGTSYNFRSASLTSGALANGATPTYAITGTDNAVNSSTLSTPTVTIDSTVPTANTTTKVAATNQTGTVSKPDVGDRIVYTYSEQIDPESILAGWTGASTNVTVRLNNNTACPGSANANDNVTIFNTSNATQANIGCVDLLTTAYVTANVTFGQTGSTTLSTMVQSGNAITVTLGSTTGTTVTTAGTRNMIWWPSATAFDAAGNAETTASQAETDADTDF
jgi:hypothetical protein